MTNISTNMNVFPPFVFVKKGIEDNASLNLPIEVGYTGNVALLIDSSQVIVIISSGIHPLGVCFGCGNILTTR